jgi:hypothetical protein
MPRAIDESAPPAAFKDCRNPAAAPYEAASAPISKPSSVANGQNGFCMQPEETVPPPKIKSGRAFLSEKLFSCEWRMSKPNFSAWLCPSQVRMSLT